MKTTVIEVKLPPTMRNPFIQQGIPDTNAARAWGERNGHAVVYFVAKKQKVYAERLLTSVDAKAEEIWLKSKDLLQVAKEQR